MKKFMSISEVQNLNIIEKVLLYKVSLNVDPLFSKTIYEEIKFKSQLNKFNEDLEKKNFDTILHSSKIDQENNLDSPISQ